MSEKEYISYADFERDCEALAKVMVASPVPVKRLVAVTRGGMVPACLIAQWLGIREVHSIALASYVGEGEKDGVQEVVTPVVADEPETVFVDDLYDSGQTYKYIRTHFVRSRIAVVYTKQAMDLDFPAVKKDRKAWIVFPWEKDV